MKKIKMNYKMLLIISFLGISCSSDDSNDSNISAEIFGKWKISSSIYGGNTENLDQCELLETIEFFENNKLDIKEYDQIGNNTNCAEVGGNTLLDYSVVNNVLTYTNPTGGYSGGEFTMKFYIRELSNQNLKLELFYETDGYGQEGNVPASEIWISNWTKVN